MGDVEKGKELYKKMCSQCHSYDRNGKNKVGPNLFGIMGRTCGSMAGFPFSNAMKDKKVKWDDNSMNEYLQQPKKYIPGTKMVFNGIKKEEDRKHIIAFLKSLK